MPLAMQAHKNELLKLTREELTVPFLTQKIGKSTKMEVDPETKKRSFKVKEPEWKMQDIVHLKAGEYINTEDVTTTMGSLLFNKLMIEGYIEDIIPGHYYNEVITSKNFEALLSSISYALMENRIKLIPNVTKFLQAFEFYGFMLVSCLAPSFTPGMLAVDEEVTKRRDELREKYGDNPDVADAVRIEDELTAIAKRKLKDDPGMMLYDSKARGSFDDNHKMLTMMGGPVSNPATGRYDVMWNNYVDGIDKDELPALANTMVHAAYSRAVMTAEGGYLTKQFYAVYQSISTDEPGTDCGSKGYMPVFLTEANFESYLWQYIVDNGKLVLLDMSNYSKYLNRVVKMRSPIGCLGQKLCSKCMGERFYKLDIRNVGLTAGRVSNSIMNANLKKFHATKVHLHAVDPNKLLI